ncbi:MAG: hypothetical protein AB1384_12395 [Actinomycetota bacterium]
MQTPASGYTTEYNKVAHKPTMSVSVLETSHFNLPEWASMSTSGSASHDETYLGKGQVIDGICAETGKFLVLDTAAKLDIYQLFGADLHCPAGWWTSIKSDAAGDFASPPYVDVEYNPAVDANGVRVSVTQVYSGAETVVVRAWYDGASDWVTVGTLVFAAGEYQKKISLGEVKSILKLRARIDSTKAASDYGRLMEVEPILEWTPGTYDITPFIESYNLRKSSGDATETAYPTPGVGINTLTVGFNANILDIFTLQENQLILVDQGFGGAHHLDQGVFVMDAPTEDSNTVDITAYSTLQFAKLIECPDRLWEKAKTSYIIKELLSYAGIAASNITTALSSDPLWQWFYIQRQKLDNALMEACRNLGVSVYEDELGQVYIRDQYGSSVMTINDDLIEDYSYIHQRLINHVAVHYSIAKPGLVEDVWHLGSDLSIPAGGTTFVFTLHKTPAIRIQSPQLEEAPTGVSLSSWSCDGFVLNVSIANTSGSTQVIESGNMRLRGRPVALSQEKVYEARDEASIRNLHARTLEITILCGTDAEAQSIGNKLLNYCKKAADVLRLTLQKPVAHLQLRDVVTVNSTYMGISSTDYVVLSIDLDLDGTVIELIPKGAFT